jgi:hypothetical protein
LPHLLCLTYPIPSLPLLFLPSRPPTHPNFSHSLIWKPLTPLPSSSSVAILCCPFSISFLAASSHAHRLIILFGRSHTRPNFDASVFHLFVSFPHSSCHSSRTFVFVYLLACCNLSCATFEHSPTPSASDVLSCLGISFRLSFTQSRIELYDLS